MTDIFAGSGYDKTKKASLLLEAQNAYHLLITGGKAAKVERNGRMVEYTKTNLNDLKQYIIDLQQSLSVTNGRSRSPARISF